jgi:tRNA dimethylallyltransferase
MTSSVQRGIAGARAPVAIALMGPTAIGKSDIALDLATRWPVEIVSVDSAQVYRGMDVGTAKPGPTERAAVPHHLIDLVEPTAPYSAARFRGDALAAIAGIHARGRIPLLVGGTMLYFKALREGLSDLPAADPATRAAIDAEAAARGWPAMHAELMRLDPATARRLAPNDAQRIQRALEVVRVSGEPMSKLLARHREVDLPFALRQIGLVTNDRAALHERIARRFARMLADGLVEEVAALRARHALTLSMPSMRAVGYRQAWDFLDERFGRERLLERGIAATRQLAKRQLTWLRSWPELDVIEGLAADAPRRVGERFAAALDPARRADD